MTMLSPIAGLYRSLSHRNGSLDLDTTSIPFKVRLTVSSGFCDISGSNQQSPTQGFCFMVARRLIPLHCFFPIVGKYKLVSPLMQRSLRPAQVALGIKKDAPENCFPRRLF